MTPASGAMAEGDGPQAHSEVATATRPNRTNQENEFMMRGYQLGHGSQKRRPQSHPRKTE
jgi:hypothetical protein